MDLAWNWASESQAYDRVHRMGQEKEVFVKRLIVRNTIEERYALYATSVSTSLTVLYRMLKLQYTKVGEYLAASCNVPYCI